MSDIFTELHAEIVARLRDEEAISAEPRVEVVQEDRGDLEAEIKRRLDAHGAVIVVLEPSITPAEDGTPNALDVTLSLGIAEKPLINRGPTGTQRTGRSLAITVMALLWELRVLAGWDPLTFVDLAPDTVDAETLAYTLRFRTRTRISVER